MQYYVICDSPLLKVSSKTTKDNQASSRFVRGGCMYTAQKIEINDITSCSQHEFIGNKLLKEIFECYISLNLSLRLVQYGHVYMMNFLKVKH